jgi:nucleotide-binding universal stress UspA family protein
VLALASFVALCMLALVVAGLVDWIVGVLFLSMEFLGQAVRGLFRRRKEHRHPPSRSRHASNAHLRAIDGHRGYFRRRGRPRRRHATPHPDGEPAPEERRMRILVPVTGDDSDLLDFAVGECLGRRAEMILLFLRPLAVTPMGPTAPPGLDEDDEARATFDRVASEAERAGVPLRTLYATTADLPTTIGEFARECEADIVIVGKSRKAGFSRFLSRDPTPSILKMLPEHASLTIRAS